MPTETYKYFQPDVNLRAAYGGGSIITFAGSDINAYTATIRAIFENIDFLNHRTRYLCRLGQDGSNNWWFKISDNLYSSISTHLSTIELSTIQSSAPSGFVERTQQAEYQPFHAGKTNITIMGDSLSYGSGTTSGLPDKSCFGQALTDMDTNISFENDNREGTGDNYYFANIANGSSSWANTVAPNNSFQYREDLRYNQQTKTLPFTYGGNNIFIYWLGTNDLAYDFTLSAADVWARAASRITTFIADHPNAKLIICTAIKRTENTILNTRINGYNNLMRANYASAGAHVLCDFENDVPEVNISTGDTTNTTYYSGDETHLIDAGHTLLMPIAKASILEAKSLLS